MINSPRSLNNQVRLPLRTMWIVDLSAPDPFRVLPIVMGVSQFVQQKLTPASGDPVQRRIFALMPIFFTILFLLQGRLHVGGRQGNDFGRQ